MIILIAGASHTGKTVLAQKLLEKHGYPYLSIDHLKMGLIRSGYTALTPEDDDRALTEYLLPTIWEIIKTAVENNQYLIVYIDMERGLHGTVAEDHQSGGRRFPSRGGEDDRGRTRDGGRRRGVSRYAGGR